MVPQDMIVANVTTQNKGLHNLVNVNVRLNFMSSILHVMLVIIRVLTVLEALKINVLIATLLSLSET